MSVKADGTPHQTVSTEEGVQHLDTSVSPTFHLVGCPGHEPDVFDEEEAVWQQVVQKSCRT